MQWIFGGRGDRNGCRKLGGSRVEMWIGHCWGAISTVADVAERRVVKIVADIRMDGGIRRWEEWFLGRNMG